MHAERTSKVRHRVLAALFLFLFSPSPIALAQTDSEAARESFEHGYALAEQGDLDGAIAAFELAYQKSPHYSVLYNLGQAYAAAGRPVEAVDALTRYLSLGGDAVAADRKQKVRAAIVYHERRVGALSLRVSPESAKVLLDGRELGAPPALKDLRLSSGQHSLLVSARGYRTQTLPFQLNGGEQRELTVDLLRDAPGLLTVTCRLLDVTAQLDGETIDLHGGTAIAPMGPGAHQLLLQRAGYLTQTRWFDDVATGVRLSEECNLAVDASFSGFVPLTVQAPAGARVLVDGSPFSAGRLPRGRHRVSVSGLGFRAEERIVELVPGRALALTLEPKRDIDRAWAASVRKRQELRSAAWIGGGVGVVAIGVGVGIYVYDGSRRTALDRKTADLIARAAQTPSTGDFSEMDALVAEENRIRDLDSVALATGVVGLTSLLASAALLLWTQPDSGARVVANRTRVELQLAF